MNKRADELAREVYPLIPHEDWDTHQELTAQQLDRRVAFICGYDTAIAKAREWFEKNIPAKSVQALWVDFERDMCL